MSSSSWWQPSKPEEIKPIPWLHPEVVRYLESILQPHWTVIEHGGGGSTLWLVERVRGIHSYEANAEWFAEMRKRLVPYGGRAQVWNQSFESPPYYRQVDLLLIDGDPPQDRAAWLDRATEIVKPGGWVVLDNANRPEYEAQRLALQEKAEFHIYFHMSHGGQRYLNTEVYKLWT